MPQSLGNIYYSAAWNVLVFLLVHINQVHWFSYCYGGNCQIMKYTVRFSLLSPKCVTSNVYMK